MDDDDKHHTTNKVTHVGRYLVTYTYLPAYPRLCMSVDILYLFFVFAPLGWYLPAYLGTYSFHHHNST